MLVKHASIVTTQLNFVGFLEYEQEANIFVGIVHRKRNMLLKYVSVKICEKSLIRFMCHWYSRPGYRGVQNRIRWDRP